MPSTLDSISELLKDQPARPPIHLWQPELSGDMDMLIKSDGSWWHEGGQIHKPSLVKLFASILRREADGHYYLVTPVEKWRVQVEDKALHIVGMEVDLGASGSRDDQQIVFTTNVDSRYLLSADFPLRFDGGSDSAKPYVDLDNGLSARVGRNVYYQLAELVVEREGRFFVFSGGERFEML